MLTVGWNRHRCTTDYDNDGVPPNRVETHTSAASILVKLENADVPYNMEIAVESTI